ncbi:MAG: conjugal transfer protein TraX [Lachnospiraceae bacterium]|nr:conjugal transfer protein TraX [Lachnospiraceae bacterium]
MMKKNKIELNRTQIKYIAIAAMLLDHLAAFLLPPEKHPTLTVLYVFMRTVGRMAGPVMFYFLVEGYKHTSSKLKYGIRLLCFGILSQIPYSLARYGTISGHNLNVMITLFMSFMMLVIADKVQEKVIKGIVVFTFMILTAFSDWGVLGPFMVWLFFVYKKDKKKQLMSYVSLCLAQIVVLALVMMSGTVTWNDGIWQIGIIFPIILIYIYNGESGKKNIINKWLFYLFYPLHLIVAYILNG